MFVAIDLPGAVCRELARLVAEPPRGVRPVRRAQLHLTLHFLGDVEEECRAALCEALGRVRHEPFTIDVRGTGVFPPQGRPSVLWAGVADSSALATLHAAIGAAIVVCGLEVEKRPYTPHITLARLAPAVPRAWTARLLGETARVEIDALPVEQFHLFDSRKLDGMTEHVIVATFPLVT